MEETPYDVIIAGAGPVGLFLACELALRKVSVLILERNQDPQDPWKREPLGLRGLNTPSAEAFYRRGLLSAICDVDEEGRPLAGDRAAEREGQPPGFTFGGHFAGIFLDASKMDPNRHSYLIPGPSMSPRPTSIERIEKALVVKAESLGVDIVRGMGVTNLYEKDKSTIIVEAGEDRIQFAGKWLVGCDGGRSVVRKAAGFDFVGTEATFTGYLATCEWESEHIRPGWHHTDNGMYIVRPPMLYAFDFDGGEFDRTQQLTQQHFQQVLRNVSGIHDLDITAIHQASTVTDRAKQATTYRRGRVLLAGDAAHIHSPLGAQGLNLGIGDAMNLGWKLAATVHHESKSENEDFRLLDTYTAERHPMGVAVLEWQRVQVATVKPDPWGAATQKLVRQMIDTNDGANLFIDRFWGLDQKYDLGDPHPLVGKSMPDFEGNNGERVGEQEEMVQEGKGLLLDFSDAELKDVLDEVGTEEGVEYVNMLVKDALGLSALFVRPDGTVAWVAEKGFKADVDGLKAALQKWSL